tara:strand:+ start:1166 stop:1381 length:216 start_codon:yes stop_codon:yes gene_type:complete
MDSTQSKNTFNNVKEKNQIKNILAEIHQEYGLKRIKFNPKSPSPNIFMGKLHKRMINYYYSLSNSRTSSRK